jgi:hypothetical protein
LGRPAWNVGRKVGVKKSLKQRQIWAIRFFLDREERMRDRALFDLAIDSQVERFEPALWSFSKRPAVRFSSKSRRT